MGSRNGLEQRLAAGPRGCRAPVVVRLGLPSGADTVDVVPGSYTVVDPDRALLHILVSRTSAIIGWTAAHQIHLAFPVYLLLMDCSALFLREAEGGPLRYFTSVR
jgi:hypothetical protein